MRVEVAVIAIAEQPSLGAHPLFPIEGCDRLTRRRNQVRFPNGAGKIRRGVEAGAVKAISYAADRDVWLGGGARAIVAAADGGEVLRNVGALTAE